MFLPFLSTPLKSLSWNYLRDWKFMTLTYSISIQSTLPPCSAVPFEGKLHEKPGQNPTHALLPNESSRKLADCISPLVTSSGLQQLRLRAGIFKQFHGGLQCSPPHLAFLLKYFSKLCKPRVWLCSGRLPSPANSVQLLIFHSTWKPN